MIMDAVQGGSNRDDYEEEKEDSGYNSQRNRQVAKHIAQIEKRRQ